MAIFKAIKETSLTEPLEPDAIYFIKEDADEFFRMHVTNAVGIPIPLEPNTTNLEFVFDTPSAEWTINHGLGKKPIVTIMHDGKVVFSDVQHLDNNTVKISHFGPEVGTVIIQK